MQIQNSIWSHSNAHIMLQSNMVFEFCGSISISSMSEYRNCIQIANERKNWQDLILWAICHAVGLDQYLFVQNWNCVHAFRSVQYESSMVIGFTKLNTWKIKLLFGLDIHLESIQSLAMWGWTEFWSNANRQQWMFIVYDNSRNLLG